MDLGLKTVKKRKNVYIWRQQKNIQVFYVGKLCKDENLKKGTIKIFEKNGLGAIK